MNTTALERITEYYGKKSSWPEVGRAVAQDALKNGQIHAVTERDVNRYQALSHALYHGRVNHSPTLRRALGLPPKTVPVEPCADCGEVHTRHKTCQRERTPAPYRTLAIRFYDDDDFDRARQELAEYEGTRAEWVMSKVKENER